MEMPEGFYRCAACERVYKSVSTPTKCAVCGAGSSVQPPAAGPGAEPMTDKFLLAVQRAKGNFRS